MIVAGVLTVSVGLGMVTLIAGVLVSLASALAWAVGRPSFVTIQIRLVAFFAALFWFWYIVPIVARIP